MSDCNGKPTAVMACAWREDLQWKACLPLRKLGCGRQARPVSEGMSEGRGMLKIPDSKFQIPNFK